MGKESKIQWTHHTFNPWWGCIKVSPACAHCYAETFAKRTGNAVWGAEAPRRFFGDKHWAEPLKWNVAAALVGARHRVFCASMADVFERHPKTNDNWLLDENRKRLFSLIEHTPNLDWLLLTKRPENINQMIPKHWVAKLPENVWVGTTVENQEYSDKRIPELVKVNACVRFLSIEPLLGPVDWKESVRKIAGIRENSKFSEHIHWVIVGGESGSGAREMDATWADSIRIQCATAGVPFFMKQMGGVRNKRGELSDMPPVLRVREFPVTHRV